MAGARAAPVAAEGALEFTLDEVQAAGDSPKPADKAPDTGAAIHAALGELHWGMSKDELLGMFKTRIRSEYNERIKAEHDVVRQDALYRQANEKFRRVKDGFVEFDGRKTGWDASSIVEEFRHGSHESMLVVDDDNARDMYFFINDRLWKWYRELKQGAFGATDFDQVEQVLQAKFGPAKELSLKRGKNGPAYPSLRWSDDKTRVTAFWRGAESCMVFEDTDTLGHLSVLRAHATPRKQKDSVLDSVVMTAAEREAWRERQR